MKLLSRNAFVLILSIFIGWLSTGCDSNSSNEATPQSACRIQKYVATSESKSSTGTKRTTYDYDTRGNLLTIVATNETRSKTGTHGQTNTTTHTYTYDADEYLTASTMQMRTVSVFDGKTTEEQLSSISSYSYTNGRVTAKSTKHTGTYPSWNGTSTLTYEYDQAGELTKIGNWLYRKNQLIDYIGTARPYTIENGLITKMIFPGPTDELVVTLMYDNQQRIIKREEYLNGQLSQYNTQTWSDAKPSSASLPAFKGFPAINLDSPFANQSGVLTTQKLFHWNSISKTMQQFLETTSSVQTNAQGFISGATITTTHPHPAASLQDVTTTETYTYTGCQ